MAHRLRDQMQALKMDMERNIESTKMLVKNELEKLMVVRKWPGLTANLIRDSVGFYGKHPKMIATEVISGVCVSTLMVPEVVAFSYAAHLEPEDGLYATVFMAIVASLLSSTGGMANGAAGALAVVTKHLMDQDGPLGDLSANERRSHVWLTIIFVGIIQILVGYFKLARFVRLIPETAIIGFLNGLSVLIFITQLAIFKTCDVQFSVCAINNTLKYMDAGSLELWLTVLCVVQTMIVMVGFSRIPVVGKVIPGVLVALIYTTAWEHLINRMLIGQGTRTIGDTSTFKGTFPSPGITILSNTRWDSVLLYAALLALVGLCESILTLSTVASKLGMRMQPGMAIQESFAQGCANLVCGLFRTQGGGAMIAQAMANLHTGGRHRMSGIVVGLSVLVLVGALPMVIRLLPVACLSGVLWVIVFRTFYWRTFALLFRIPIEDAITILLVSILAVVYDLATGVVVGVVWSSLCHSWNGSRLLTIKVEKGSVKEYKVDGPLYFGSAHGFIEQFDVLKDKEVIQIDLSGCKVLDYSGVHAIDHVICDYKMRGTEVEIVGIQDESRMLIDRLRMQHVQGALSEEVVSRDAIESTMVIPEITVSEARLVD